MKQSKRQFQGRETPIRKEGIREGKEKSSGGDKNQYHALFLWKSHNETYYFV